jgi:hypothetical protein
MIQQIIIDVIASEMTVSLWKKSYTIGFETGPKIFYENI